MKGEERGLSSGCGWRVGGGGGRCGEEGWVKRIQVQFSNELHPTWYAPRIPPSSLHSLTSLALPQSNLPKIVTQVVLSGSKVLGRAFYEAGRQAYKSMSLSLCSHSHAPKSHSLRSLSRHPIQTRRSGNGRRRRGRRQRKHKHHRRLDTLVKDDALGGPADSERQGRRFARKNQSRMFLSFDSLYWGEGGGAVLQG